MRVMRAHSVEEEVQRSSFTPLKLYTDGEDNEVELLQPEEIPIWSTKKFRALLAVGVVFGIVLGVVGMSQGRTGGEMQRTSGTDTISLLEDVCAPFNGIWHPFHHKCCPAACGQYCGRALATDCWRGPGGSQSCCQDVVFDLCVEGNMAPCMTPNGFSSTTTTTTTTIALWYDGTFSFSADVSKEDGTTGVKKAIVSYFGLAAGHVSVQVDRLSRRRLNNRGNGVDFWNVKFEIVVSDIQISTNLETMVEALPANFAPFRMAMVTELSKASGHDVDKSLSILTFDALTKPKKPWSI